MKEVKDLAKSVKDLTSALRADAARAVSAFKAEHHNTRANIAKVNAMAAELKEANKEIEAVLGEVSSNFPEEVQGNRDKDGNPKPVDENGVTLNKE